MKMLKKDGKLTKPFFKKIKDNPEILDYSNADDIGISSIGIIKVDLFSGGFGNFKRHHKYLGSKYYLIEIVNDNYTNGLHRFTCHVLQVISGSKSVGDKFTKRGKNLYENYYEIEQASLKSLANKHNRAYISKGLKLY